ncbi:hypothetical protein H109_04366 [Trichophyton interdigitale MR816]|uniref:Uncharacterized protein n=1 Tax=Trichophyton interdigitale (strain MR816) TaxID=1215338 RepID=A0A059J799_TRIIM|nr:hypothetical protein H101_01003 [Trichophyton interdigitale H6]KDB23741.1 hypothetical protein H109_04366 [Trichophyton interdigitale MR816]
MVGIPRRPERSDDSGYGSIPSRGVTTTIEHWVASRDPFRIAAGSQLPMPLRSKRIRANIEWEDIYKRDIHPGIPEILTKYGLSLGVDTLDRVQPWDDSYEMKDVITITTHDASPRKDWQDAADTVLALVKEKVPTDVSHPIQVEIINLDKMYQDVSSPLPNDRSIVGPLEQVKDRIVEEVQVSMQGAWLSIAFHLRHHRNSFDEPMKPTILVICRPRSVCDFVEAEDRLLDILNELDISVYLEFLPGRTVLANPGPKPMPMYTHVEDLPEKPTNGSSIGVKGNETSAGTLGGWLILNLPKEQRQIKCALTCYHVIRGDDSSTTDYTDTHGVHWNDTRGHLTIQYPAAIDARAALENLDKLCHNFPGDQRLEKQKNMVSDLLLGPGIGKVVLASGSQVRNNHRVDWALIESPETFSKNKPPSIRQGNFMSPPAGHRYAPHPDTKISQFDHVHEDDWVVKLGRTTLTSGIINGMKTVEWGPNFVTEEIQVMSHYADVAVDGDSGAFVVNEHGHLVGMLYAVTKESTSFNTAYITPFDAIQAHIKEMTNGGFLSFD